jgi:hypothetical protein
LTKKEKEFFGDWIHKFTWTLAEASYLLVGLEPPTPLEKREHVQGHEVNILFHFLAETICTPQFHACLFKRRYRPGDEAQTSIAVPVGVVNGKWINAWIGHERMTPNDWYRAAKKHGWSLELIRKVRDGRGVVDHQGPEIAVPDHAG